MNPRYLLFDVDGTLIGRCPAHGRSMLRGLRKFFGLTLQDFGFAPAGMTDWGILRDCAVSEGVSDEEFEEKRTELFAWVETDFLQEAQAGDVTLLPAVAEALQWLSTTQLRAGLLTGNLEAVAWHKMALAGIRHHFQGGGFGCQAAERFKLVDCARERALRDGLAAADVVLIGDTPRDIAAARDAGVPCIAVATGPFSREQLEQYAPDALLENLSKLPDSLAAIST